MHVSNALYYCGNTVSKKVELHSNKQLHRDAFDSNPVGICQRTMVCLIALGERVQAVLALPKAH